MVDLFSAALQIWSQGKAALRHQDVLVSYDFDTKTLTFKQYPELIAGSRSFVFIALPLSAARFLCPSATSASTKVISMTTLKDIRAVLFVDETDSSHQEEAITLQMCCSLVDCSLAESSKLDVLPNQNSTEPSNVELLLDLLGDVVQPSEAIEATEANEVQLDLSEELVDLLLNKGGVDRHSQSSNIDQDVQSFIYTSVEQSTWLSSRDDQRTVSSMFTPVTHDEELTQEKTSDCRTEASPRFMDHVARWNSFAESNGAAPRRIENTSSCTTISNSYRPQLYKSNTTGARTTTATGGYLIDRRRDYSVIEDDSTPARGGAIARRRNGNQQKNANHSTAQNTYILSHYLQGSVMAKHGSVW